MWHAKETDAKRGADLARQALRPPRPDAGPRLSPTGVFRLSKHLISRAPSNGRLGLHDPARESCHRQGQQVDGLPCEETTDVAALHAFAVVFDHVLTCVFSGFVFSPACLCFAI